MKPPKTAHEAARCGSIVHAQTDMASMEKAKPDNPWAKPARAAPATMGPIRESTGGPRPEAALMSGDNRVGDLLGGHDGRDVGVGAGHDRENEGRPAVSVSAAMMN